MRSLTCLLVISFIQLSSGLSLPVKKSDLFKRQTDEISQAQIGCISMQKQAGEFTHISDGNGGVCGLYLVAEPDKVIQIEFTEFSISCDNNGLMALVDGWELQSEFFPNIEDTGDSFSDRYKMFCGDQSPSHVYTASQNVALIQFRIAQPGQGFRVRISHYHNPQPCNVMAMPETGVITMKNYGLRRNCTVSIIYPENVLLLSVDIATTRRDASTERERGLSLKCHGEAGADYVEFLFGNGLDIAYMRRRMAFCGLKSKAAKRGVTLGCQNTAVRLVSSGTYYNSITFSISQPSPQELDTFRSQYC